jgi:exopolysaccharide biosynthesis polyprenyl glycosylphosphotransferase
VTTLHKLRRGLDEIEPGIRVEPSTIADAATDQESNRPSWFGYWRRWVAAKGREVDAGAPELTESLASRVRSVAAPAASPGLDLGPPVGGVASPRPGHARLLWSASVPAGFALLCARGLTLVIAFLVVLTAERDSQQRALVLAALASTLWFAARRLSSMILPVAVGRVSRAGAAAVLGAIALAIADAQVRRPRIGLLTLAVLGLVVFTLLVLFESRPRDRRILLVGRGEGAEDLIAELAAGRSGFKIAAVVGEFSAYAPDRSEIPTYGSLAALPEAVTIHRPDLVVVDVDSGRPEVFRSLLDLAGAGFRVAGLPEFYEHAFGRIPLDRVGPAWFMSVIHLYQRSYTAFAKRVFDVVGAILALLLTAPVLLIIALLVRRPFLLRQVRVGEWGRTFTMYKFRTMHEEAEPAGVPLFAAVRDPRTTKIGRLLRKTRLDELPQLWNVLRGEMSLVGPRPERPEFYSMLTEQVPWWIRRNMVKPGITGWAQIHSGYADDPASTADKLSYDLWYLRHRSLSVDLMICIQTLPKLIFGFGAR